MRLSFARAQSSPQELIDVGCELMRKLGFGRRTDVDNYRLGMVGRACLIGEKGAAAVQEICHNLKESILKSETYAFYHAELLQILLATQPLAALEALCGRTKGSSRRCEYSRSSGAAAPKSLRRDSRTGAARLVRPAA